jgi:hypothetical protein
MYQIQKELSSGKTKKTAILFLFIGNGFRKGPAACSLLRKALKKEARDGTIIIVARRGGNRPVADGVCHPPRMSTIKGV